MAPVPVRAVGVEAALAGASATESAIAAAAAHAAEGTSPTTDVSASADYRTHMVVGADPAGRGRGGRSGLGADGGAPGGIPPRRRRRDPSAAVAAG